LPQSLPLLFDLGPGTVRLCLHDIGLTLNFGDSP
jgi:hypothetical protein